MTLYERTRPIWIWAEKNPRSAAGLFAALMTYNFTDAAIRYVQGEWYGIFLLAITGLCWFMLTVSVLKATRFARTVVDDYEHTTAQLMGAIEQQNKVIVAIMQSPEFEEWRRKAEQHGDDER